VVTNTVVPIIRDYRSKIASNSFTGKVNTRDFSALFTDNTQLHAWTNYSGTRSAEL